MGKRIGVVGPVHLALKEALFLKEYSGQVTLLASYPEDISEDARGMASAGVIESGTPSRIWSLGQPGSTLSWPTERQCGTWMWCTPQWALMCALKLAVALGAGCDAQGYVLVSRHLETSTAGLYAIGDVAEGLNQIAVAFGHAATAARHIDNALQSRPGS
ncbi:MULTISPECIES: FAD-dependent oxidoreductase [unclassified Mesorhizobium]|uniref:FAD-dependent oxidoreductase n=1 Tax=unclassified Mesorhizobium TaxID=325217 RepID=UPI001FE15B0B|nr:MULTISPECIES: FAD-dependent oxidoreductase [unclassified Mesorhizobium]